MLRFKVSASLLQGVRITSRCTAGIAREVALEGVEVGRDEAVGRFKLSHQRQGSATPDQREGSA